MIGSADQIADAANGLYSVHVRKAKVDDREVRLVRGGVDRAALAARGLDHAVALGPERRAQKAADLGLVLHQEDRGQGLGHGATAAPQLRCGIRGIFSTGRVKRNAVPPSGLRSTQILP